MAAGDEAARRQCALRPVAAGLECGDDVCRVDVAPGNAPGSDAATDLAPEPGNWPASRADLNAGKGDLVAKLRTGAELRAPNYDALYTPGLVGYTDYPEG